MAKLKTIDTIGELDEEIAKLTKRREKLAANIKDYRGVGNYTGEFYEASVYEMETTKINVEKLKKRLGADYAKFVRKGTATCLRVQKIGRKKRRKARGET